jgi:hypothetical protein
MRDQLGRPNSECLQASARNERLKRRIGSPPKSCTIKFGGRQMREKKTARSSQVGANDARRATPELNTTTPLPDLAKEHFLSLFSPAHPGSSSSDCSSHGARGESGGSFLLLLPLAPSRPHPRPSPSQPRPDATAGSPGGRRSDHRRRPGTYPSNIL